jgi:hypothetical protein
MVKCKKCALPLCGACIVEAVRQSNAKGDKFFDVIKGFCVFACIYRNPIQAGITIGFDMLTNVNT